MASIQDYRFFTKPIVLLLVIALVASVLLGSGASLIRDAMHSDAISACEDLRGSINNRDYRCTLPDGRVVDPLKWAAVHGR